MVEQLVKIRAEMQLLSDGRDTEHDHFRADELLIASLRACSENDPATKSVVEDIITAFGRIRKWYA